RLGGAPAGRGGDDDDRAPLLRSLLLPCLPSGLHREEGRRSAGGRTSPVGAARRARRRVSGGAQRRPPLSRQAGAGRVLPGAGPHQQFQSGNRPDIEMPPLVGSGASSGVADVRAWRRACWRSSITAVSSAPTKNTTLA